MAIALFLTLVAFLCLSYSMKLNVVATTHDMYIGRKRKRHSFIRIYSRTSTPPIQYSFVMGKLQSHKKIVIESDSRRQTSIDTKQTILSSRDPRTVCMNEAELAYLQASFRVNRWPERAEKERLARIIGKYVAFLPFFFLCQFTSVKVL